MAEDIKTTPQHWATIHVDFENRLYIAIAIGYRVYIIYDIVKKFYTNYFVWNWLYENILRTKINQIMI